MAMATRLAAALVIASLSMLPAQAAMTSVTPGAMAPALGVYVDALVRAHAAALACAAPNSPVRDDTAWVRAKAVFIATLWANGFSPDFIKEAGARLDGPQPGAKPDCKDPVATSDLDFVEGSGWGKEIERVFSSIELTAIAAPVSAGQWQAIKDAVAAELPAEKRLLECTAVALPTLMPNVVHDWDDMLAKVAGKLIAAGLPRDEISALIGSAEANVLWRRPPADAVAALATSCAGDEAWSRRLYNFEFLGLGSDVDKLLPHPAADAQ
jgi:hypothetical protein